MSNQRFYPGEQITQQFSPTNAGVAFDPTTVTFKWRQGRGGSITTETPSNPTTGDYRVSFTPTGTGPVHYRWETTGPVIVEEGTQRIRTGKFTNEGVSDYA